MTGFGSRRFGALIGALTVVFAVAFVPAADAAPASVSFNGTSHQYSPATVTIKQGDAVTWSYGGDEYDTANVYHTVSSTSPESFDSDPANQCGETNPPDGACFGPDPDHNDRTFSHTFNSAGSFNYRCHVHGDAMRGTVVVQAVAPPPPPPAPPAAPIAPPAAAPVKTATPKPGAAAPAAPPPAVAGATEASASAATEPPASTAVEESPLAAAQSASKDDNMKVVLLTLGAVGALVVAAGAGYVIARRR